MVLARDEVLLVAKSIDVDVNTSCGSAYVINEIVKLDTHRSSSFYSSHKA
jgi:hypothetical protein